MNLSIVIPIHNEASSIKMLYDEIKKTVESYSAVKKIEVIFVNDGSSDKTDSVLERIQDNRIRRVDLKKRFGQSFALNKGFQIARHDIIATIDGDLQFEPREIIEMAREISEGYDCVCGYRHRRVDPFIKRNSSMAANYIRRLILDDDFNDIGCPLRVFRRECIEDIPYFEGYHRFLPLLFQKKGYRVKEVKVTHRPRLFGKSKYNISNRIVPSIRGLFLVKRLISN